MKHTALLPALAILGCLIWPVHCNEENATPRQQGDFQGRPTRRGPQRSTTRKQNVTQADTEAPKESDEFDTLNQALVLLQRLNDRLTGLQALDEQQLRRLETIEYRFTKLEVQQQEKVEGLRTELREVARRVQQQDWQTSKIDTTLESIKLDVAGLSQGHEHLRGMLSVPENRYHSTAESDIKHKIQTLIALNMGMKGTSTALFDTLTNLVGNFTYLNNVTRLLIEANKQLVTKQHLKTVLLDLNKPSHSTSNMDVQFVNNEERIPRDCSAIKEQGKNQSGIYRIQPTYSMMPFYAYCDLETKGGGWTVIQNRFEGTIDFNRGWEDYKFGFGNLGGEFWIGLEKLHLLTNYKVNELYIELEDFSLMKTHAQYSAFAISNEIQGYSIQVLGGYEGDAGDSLIYHAGMKFSTYDMDNDGWQGGNCAESHTGAWWYNGCDTSNLNGRYLGGELVEDYEYQGMYWYDWHGPLYSLMKSRMAIRPTRESHSPIYNVGEDRTINGQEIQKNHTTFIERRGDGEKRSPKTVSQHLASKNEDTGND